MRTAEKVCEKMARLRRLTSVQVPPSSHRQQQCARVVHVADAASSFTTTATDRTSVVIRFEPFVLLWFRFFITYEQSSIKSVQFCHLHALNRPENWPWPICWIRWDCTVEHDRVDDLYHIGLNIIKRTSLYFIAVITDTFWRIVFVR